MGIKASEAARAFKAMGCYLYLWGYHIQNGVRAQYLPSAPPLLEKAHRGVMELAEKRLASLGDRELSAQSTTSLHQLWDLCFSLMNDICDHHQASPDKAIWKGVVVILQSPFSAKTMSGSTVPEAEQAMLVFVEQIMQGIQESTEGAFQEAAAFREFLRQG